MIQFCPVAYFFRFNLICNFSSNADLTVQVIISKSGRYKEASIDNNSDLIKMVSVQIQFKYSPS